MLSTLSSCEKGVKISGLNRVSNPDFSDPGPDAVLEAIRPTGIWLLGDPMHDNPVDDQFRLLSSTKFIYLDCELKRMYMILVFITAT